MSNVETLEHRLSRGEVLLLDGAIGTELERRGVPMDESVWCARALDTHPDTVREVHRDYIDAGADVITANTYAATRAALAGAKAEDRFRAWNERAMAIALEARDASAVGRPVAVAGSVSTFPVVGAEATGERGWYREQGERLVAAGAELILLETLGAPPGVVVETVEATADLGVPVWVGLSCLRDRATDEIVHGVEESGDSPDEPHGYAAYGAVIERVMAAGGSALLTMHSELGVIDAAVTTMRAHYPGPIGAYPNAGYWERPTWIFVDQITPGGFAAAASGWVAAGAQIVGGCCGIGPEHIAALRVNLS